MNKTLNAALIGGGTFGLLSALPYIQYANTLCCALYIGGGVFAMYLYMRDQGTFAKAPYGDGALVGVLSGVFAAVAATVIGVVLNLLGLGADPAEVAEAMAAFEQSGVELPEWVLDFLGARGMTVSSVLTNFALNGVLAAIFATIGGLVGAATFHKQNAA